MLYSDYIKISENIVSLILLNEKQRENGSLDYQEDYHVLFLNQYIINRIEEKGYNVKPPYFDGINCLFTISIYKKIK